MALLKPFLRAILLLILVGAAIVGVAVVAVSRRGLSARAEPTHAEAVLAHAMRRFATPSAVRNRANPVQGTPAVLEDAMAHFADHCASCHANDGSGDTAIGRGLYPRPPDMRASTTQSLTDGELFSIIENGIRLTGMPAWGDGTPEGELSSWALVRFIRHLPSLTPDDVARMETLNPKTPDELQEQEEERRFLEGEDVPAGRAGHRHDHDKQP